MSCASFLHSPLESDILKAQIAASNITTYKCYPFPGRLVEVPYPLDEEGYPVSPLDLISYSQTHLFRLPTCFHGREVNVVVNDCFDACNASVVFECAVDEAGETACAFFVNVGALLKDEFNMMFHQYRKRFTLSLALNGSARSSLHSLSSEFGSPELMAPLEDDLEIVVPADNIVVGSTSSNGNSEEYEMTSIDPSSLRLSNGDDNDHSPDSPHALSDDISSILLEAVDIELALREMAEEVICEDDHIDEDRWM
ncbi:hypothetical protein CVT26_011188 [Gymnopilus dilepis]|uniref:Uncharacterized protein n=1 Tax=Gymnopilus dilepis TaxID=231916 RepID=A0A409VJT2_9AGAR|nr:hypothetical protein CVT26_011188 [Gymnopilus dilepis]